MRNILYLAVLAIILSACVPIASDPARDEFGLSTGRSDGGSAPPTPAETAKLDWKAGQTCTHGYMRTGLDVQPAERGQQIVAMQLLCNHYDRLDFDYMHMSWSNLL